MSNSSSKFLILILIRYIAPEGPTSLARTTQASQLCAIGVLTSYRLLICAEFDQAQACIRLRRNDSSAHHIAPLPPRRQVLAVLLPTSDQTGLEGLPLRVLPSFSSYCLSLDMATPYPNYSQPTTMREKIKDIPIAPPPPSSPAYLSGRILRLDPSNSLKSCSDPASNPRPTVRGAARYH